ncbi:MAG: hypothetical protein AAF639_21780 [Chloroflexota bacterium]
MVNTILKILVRDDNYARILRHLLREENLPRVKFYSALGESQLASAGRNIVVMEGPPLLVIQDADTLNKTKAHEENGLTKATIRQVAGESVVDVFSFIPSIEIIFFENQELLEYAIGKKLPLRIEIEGELLPSRAFQRLLKEELNNISLETFLEKYMTDDIAEELREGGQLQKLITAIDQIIQRHTHFMTAQEHYALAGRELVF